jgi:hypothetical protein
MERKKSGAEAPCSLRKNKGKGEEQATAQMFPDH